mmetsp:Transcript_45077/g.136666  ORF Transcript_45077/g.136666 Transcript_45077/m.136666 type:complete len:261 (+) Transcript_45077:843-1625(+)
MQIHLVEQRDAVRRARADTDVRRLLVLRRLHDRPGQARRELVRRPRPRSVGARASDPRGLAHPDILVVVCRALDAIRGGQGHEEGRREETQTYGKTGRSGGGAADGRGRDAGRGGAEVDPAQDPSGRVWQRFPIFADCHVLRPVLHRGHCREFELHDPRRRRQSRISRREEVRLFRFAADHLRMPGCLWVLGGSIFLVLDSPPPEGVGPGLPDGVRRVGALPALPGPSAGTTGKGLQLMESAQRDRQRRAAGQDDEYVRR